MAIHGSFCTTMQCPPNHQPPSEPDQHARGLRTRNRHAMKRVCRKVASTTDYNLHQGTGATRRSVRARARSTYLLSSRALLRRDGGIENRAGARADVAVIILSSAKGGREGGVKMTFSKVANESGKRIWTTGQEGRCARRRRW